jgi:4-amino-4-deoxy-L-arabinose transferase-like glycosyltransferase
MQNILKWLTRLKMKSWLAIVASVSLVERILLYLLYRPVIYNDSTGYRRTAEAILGGWTNIDGTRTPSYPIFLALIGPDERVYLAQLVLGVFITILFFFIGWRLSRQGWFAALAAFAYTLNLQQLLIEADILTETLTIFMIALCLAGMIWLLNSDSKRPVWQVMLVGLGVGAAAGVAALVRTLFVFLPLLTALVLLIFWHVRMRVRVAAALPVLLVGLVIIGGWVNFIHQRFGIWSMDTMTGYHLMNHAGLFFEDVPDEYAGICDTFIRYRDAQVALTGNAGNAIWDAIPDMMQVSGLGFYSLSSVLARISVSLILQHPVQYLLTVGEGWMAFWKVPLHWGLVSPVSSFMLTVRSNIILLVRGALFLINLAFIAGTFALVWKKIRRVLPLEPFLVLSVSMIWIASILQAFVEYGDNPRYSIPVQSLVLFVVLWWSYTLLNRKKLENPAA